MSRFVWCKDKGIDISSKGAMPYSILSPFACSTSYAIPVPGQEHIRSDSVEGIWQGLKLIEGQADFSQLHGRATKRKKHCSGHVFCDKPIGYREARYELYVPAYTYHLINNALPQVWSDLEAQLAQGDVLLHDIDQNGSIKNIDSSYAHSSLAADLLNVLNKSPLPKFSAQAPIGPINQGSLEEDVSLTLDYRTTLSEWNQRLLDEIITFAYLFSKNSLKELAALRYMCETGVNLERAESYIPSPKTFQAHAALRR